MRSILYPNQAAWNADGVNRCASCDKPISLFTDASTWNATTLCVACNEAAVAKRALLGK